MKITIDVDLTPKELRTFLGLPDVEPLQQELLDRIGEKMRAGVEGYDALNLLQPLLLQGLPAMEAMQKAFWKAFTSQAGSSKSKPSNDE